MVIRRIHELYAQSSAAVGSQGQQVFELQGCLADRSTRSLAALWCQNLFVEAHLYPRLSHVITASPCSSGGPESSAERQDLPKHFAVARGPRLLESDVVAVADPLAPILFSCSATRFRRLGHRQRPREVDNVTCESLELKADGVAANVRHDSRVHFLSPLPSLIPCSAVRRWLENAPTHSVKPCQVGND